MASRHVSGVAWTMYALAAIFCVIGYGATRAGSAGWAAVAFVVAVLFAATGLATEDRR